MAYSSVIAPPIATSQEIRGNNDLVNESTNNWYRIAALISLLCLLHSWIWLDMWVEVLCGIEVKRSVPISLRIGSWKCVRNTVANEPKSTNECCGSSMYHFAAVTVKVRWKSHNRTESSMREFEEHHKWNVVTWFFLSSPCFPSNFGMFDGNFTRMGGHEGFCRMGSLINLDKSCKSKVVRKGNWRLGCTYW